MSTWLNAWRNRGKDVPDVAVLELVVVAGADAGSQFTLEGAEVLVGRGESRSGETQVIRLEDKSISRQQAWIRCDSSGASIEHVSAASNPTRVNGQELGQARLSVGDRIEMGRVMIEVRTRVGTNLSGLTEIMEGAARDITRSERHGSANRASVEDSNRDMPGATTAVTESTEIRPMKIQLGELRILRGATPAILRSSIGMTREGVFRFGAGPTRIGRSEDAEIRIAEPGVSRIHAEIEVEDGSIVLRQRSRTNPTLVNGLPVLTSSSLCDGDEIQLADRVVLGVRLMRAEDARRVVSGDPKEGLSRRMESKIRLDRAIEEFNVMGTFLDVDVVASRAMKVGSAKPEHIIASFDRFRGYVTDICLEFGGQVLNSNGDELMCFFESASSAVEAGLTILERLAAFNRDLNLLSPPFRFRLGAHTGASLVDLNAGVAYSEVLDTAGHIQKRAEPNSLVISEATLNSAESLAGRIGVTVVDGAESEVGPLFRVVQSARGTNPGAS